MITKINVKGFKSLDEFNLSFRKGLNVLIGPNGAGKTNICHALGMIAAVCDNTISDYIISLGGTASLFTSTINNSKTRLKISCRGKTTERFAKETISLRYRYSFTLILRPRGIEIYYERLKLERLLDNGNYTTILIATRNSKGHVKINIVDSDNIGPLNLSVLEKENIPEFKIEMPQMNGFLVVLSSLIFSCHIIHKDLRFSRAWNIDPHLAKRPTDVLEPPTMLPDGRRLANALHQMKTADEPELQDLNILLGSILPGFSRLDPVLYQETMLRSFSITDNNGMTCPANCLSDGTIKTIALLVGVYGQKASTNIIEEPENYLHPWACQSLIEYLRDYFQNGACIVTTHSETILNMVAPKELIIVENVKGLTKATRLFQKNNLEKAIQESGFGCGYHYIAGSFGGTPE